MAETLFEVIVGTSSTVPDDLPLGYSAPKQCLVPATASLTRVQLKLKNELWPTVFSPHLLPTEIRFSKEDVSNFQLGMKMAVEEARLAAGLNEVCLLQCLDIFTNHVIIHQNSFRLPPACCPINI
jgi:hypothetical protein